MRQKTRFRQKQQHNNKKENFFSLFRKYPFSFSLSLFLSIFPLFSLSFSLSLFHTLFLLSFLSSFLFLFFFIPLSFSLSSIKRCESFLLPPLSPLQKDTFFLSLPFARSLARSLMTKRTRIWSHHHHQVIGTRFLLSLHFLLFSPLSLFFPLLHLSLSFFRSLSLSFFLSLTLSLFFLPLFLFALSVRYERSHHCLVMAWLAA